MALNDIYLEQVNDHGTFTETYLSVIPNGIVITDSKGHLTVTSSLPASPSASYALTSSYSMNASDTSDSSSWASSSLSASFAVSSSYVPNLYPQVPQVTVQSASWVS
jgi:hypothetical protein